MTATRGLIIGIVFLIAIPVIIGCGATKEITEEIADTTKKITGQIADLTGRGRNLKKKIAFLPAVNRTGQGDEAFREAARTQLETALKGLCDNVIVVDSPQTRNLLEQIPRLPTGQLDTLAVTVLGRSLGVNALIEEILFGTKCVTDKRGVYGFRDTCFLAQLSISIRAYDIETGALLFDEIFEDEVEVSEYEWQEIKTGMVYNKNIVERLLASTTEGMSKRICDLLEDEPWKGYVTSFSENTFTISAGGDVGLMVGDQLEVFSASEPIKGQGGQLYFVSGPKVGNLNIAQVYEDRAEALGSVEIDLDKISHVRLKR